MEADLQNVTHYTAKAKQSLNNFQTDITIKIEK